MLTKNKKQSKSAKTQKTRTTCVAYQNRRECALLNLQEHIRTDGISGEDQSACSEGTDNSWTLTNARKYPVQTKISTRL